jgi:hypothetical protein
MVFLTNFGVQLQQNHGAMAGKPGHGVLMSIWRCPKIWVPPNHPFVDGFSLFSPSSYGVPPFMETPISPKWHPSSSPRYRTPAQNLGKSVILSGLFKKLLVGKPIF